MKKIRSYLAAIALLATLALSGLSLPGMGSASIANAASSRQASAVSSPHVVGKLASSQAPNLFRPPCPGGGGSDC